MIFELVRDFAEVLDAMPQEHPIHGILKLLDKAIRRDVHFIHRHPRTLFQCLWNSCWWFDCPQVANHYDDIKTDSVAWGVPAAAPKPRLSRLLESWQLSREMRDISSPWLRSCRPPVISMRSLLCGRIRNSGTSILSACFTHDGAMIATGAEDTNVRLYDVATLDEYAVLQGHTGAVKCICPSPSGNRLVSGSRDATARVWDFTSATELLVLIGHEQAVNFVSYAPDGKTVATGSDDSTVRLWNAVSGEMLLVLRGHMASVNSVCWAPDGKHIASASFDGTIRIWDTVNGVEAGRLESSSVFLCVTYSADGSRLLSGSWHDSMQIWNSSSHEEWLRSKEDQQIVSSICISPDGTLAVTGCGPFGCGNHSVNVIDVESGNELQSIHGFDDSVDFLMFRPDGRHFLSVSGGEVRVWENNVELRPMERPEHRLELKAIRHSLDGNIVVSGSWDGTLRFWNAMTGEPMREVPASAPVVTVACSNNCRQVVSGGADGTIQIWDSTTGSQLGKKKCHQSAVRCLCYSADDRFLASGSEDLTFKIWDLKDFTMMFESQELNASIKSISFSRDGTSLAIGCVDGSIRQYHWLGNNNILRFLGHKYSVNHIRFSTDGTRLVSRDVYEERVWCVLTGECLKISGKFTDEIASVNGIEASCFRLDAKGLESTVVAVETDCSVAWFTELLARSSVHPSGLQWAGTSGRHLHIVSLQNHNPVPLR